MRVLVVADEHPWPPTSGYRQRLARVVGTLGSHHDVDVLVVRHDGRPAPPPPHDLALGRVGTVQAPGHPGSAARRAWRWWLSDHPRSLSRHDWTPARSELATWATESYDAVWWSHATTYLRLGDLVDLPAVVDLDNLESEVLRHRRESRRRAKARGARDRARRAARMAADTLDERRWRRAEQAVRDRVEVVAVCSDLDRERLGGANVVVVENGYERPDEPAEAADHRSAPVVLMVGLLTYEPNLDAATYFAREVLPLLRRHVPGAVFRVVGRFDHEWQVATLRGLEGVELTGEVPDLGEELRAATLSVVPVRFGGGTRIKILEAFAYGVPVVSTTVGAEGLEVEPGTHLLVADAPEDLAASCARLVGDLALRRALAAAGRRLWHARYRSDLVAPTISAALERAVADAG
ncbi:glycosyltransferase [Nocardioides aurantiacus]|uniref:Glycosyltransferase involved in cell wall biosynthesis n=1 Tax=Nocardioides aurantiacus TaxID=86796 RepID=A0A3N2CSA2_9ACTN|nr:glycosyltransferase family 4 protein [Nocardioides aurantiacus]ROR90124.1 glycosyltransferase involved in cell wall biosynthesis [Nocardioides aurantiacus]